MSGSGKVVHVLSGVEYDEYVGRSIPRYGLVESFWANPFKIGASGATREQVLEAYERYIRQIIQSPAGGTQGDVSALRGKTLACWCAPKDKPLTLDDPVVCHGQIILKLADELDRAQL